MPQVNMDHYLATRIEAWLHRQQPNTATIDIPELGAAVGTTIGEVRKENQDRVIVARLFVVPDSRPTTVFAVCDGLGGMVNGAQCAERTLAVLLNSFIYSPMQNTKDRMRAAISMANQEIFRQYRQSGGTTLALLCRSVDSLFAATAGDTRLYSLSPRSPLKQVSVDDTIAGELSRRTDINPDNYRLEPYANQLAQFVGVGPELEPRFYDLSPQATMSYFIASDGAYNIGTAFERVLANVPSPLVAAQRIIQASRWMGGKDNASIICVGPDRTDMQRPSEESVIELWSATGKLEILLGCYPMTFDRPSRAPVHRKDPVNYQMDHGRKGAKNKKKDEQYRVEPKSPTPNRPLLKIEFGEPNEHGQEEQQSKDHNL